MTEEEPPYLGSWKGRVLEAIAIYNVRDWDSLLIFTELTHDSLNTALSELYDLGILSRSDDGGYWIEHDVYNQYRAFFANVPVEEEPQKKVEKAITEEVLPEDEDIARWVIKWRDFKNLTFSLDARHFFLEGTYIDDLSKDLIRQAKHEVLLVNPFIEQCHLSNTLLDAIANKAQVIVVTRHIHEQDKYLEEKQAYHKYLQNEGVQFHYHRRIHAKLLVVDKQIAVISSMNFIVSSTGGSSWEAGMISIDEAIVNSVTQTIYELLDRID
ncbi:MAG: phospholipase D-like domain-containing protein [Candidatus Bathyarchaeota archaeon]|nr:phospholipase D-like domain-containing protein [Candidatus Bathyarchaeota archaeon]